MAVDDYDAVQLTWPTISMLNRCFLASLPPDYTIMTQELMHQRSHMTQNTGVKRFLRKSISSSSSLASGHYG